MLLTTLVACADDKPAEIPLSILASQRAAYEDKRVATQRMIFETPRHYWIEDEGLKRVKVFPQERIAPYLGEQIRIVGRFQYGQNEGCKLEMTDRC
ncbi:glucose-inhibited division protein B [Pistricoccus aurantiacus]|uniref:Glucose-inhibited division protein B n=1 Tax=Pistricoccus aurantiacus TaxID=1883414 RepID=A0A5B8SUH8_9GAMM|nr:hypothetical protein [Pistricoccus aurantiacus]QEA39165.1 glucose-inhibited division protein B [Pistricoccus aurantiacus]